MPALSRPLRIEQGVTWASGWQFLRASDHAPAFDSTCAVRAQIRETAGSSVVLHEWSTGAGNASIDDTGILRLTVEPADSSAWTWTTATYDVEITDTADNVTRILSGDVIVSREVTR